MLMFVCVIVGSREHLKIGIAERATDESYDYSIVIIRSIIIIIA